MWVRFWGTRGSIATPGASTLRYGGNTACIEVRTSSGTLLVIDCGTGARGLGQHLMASEPRPLRGHLLISHTHWDHIQGLPFFAPLFVPGNEWDIYAPRGLARSLRDTLAGQMQSTYFPVTLEQLGATIRYHDLVEGVLDADDVRVQTQYLHHPALTLGYRLEADGTCLVYASDHEPFARHLAAGGGRFEGRDRHHAEFLAGADLVVHDAQYTAAEYPAKVGWGHSTLEYAVAACHVAGVRQLALIHHDPLRDDASLEGMVTALRRELTAKGRPLEVMAAREGEVIELQGREIPQPPPDATDFSAATPMPTTALSGRLVLLAMAASPMAAALEQVLRADRIEVRQVSDGNEALRLCQTEHPALVLIEETLPPIGGLALCRALRQREEAATGQTPIVIIAREENAAAGAEAGVTDWLLEPFSTIYAEVRIRAWLLRSHCRWLRAPVPADEEQRLAALRRLGLLDTRPEERFDRLTRLATGLFKVPMALVSLLDRERQWLKSTCGVAVRQTSREASFCAHAILRREVMIVPDALLDMRFADNPFVVGEPRIRFYAGCPLVLQDGSCVGTLCILDTRPRQLDGIEIHHLQDLGALVEQELGRSPRTSAG